MASPFVNNLHICNATLDGPVCLRTPGAHVFVVGGASTPWRPSPAGASTRSPPQTEVWSVRSTTSDVGRVPQGQRIPDHQPFRGVYSQGAPTRDGHSVAGLQCGVSSGQGSA